MGDKDKEEADVKSKEQKLMMQKLREHLTNLEQIEAMLVRDPWNDELHKLKTDLHEVIRLISWRMLTLKKEKKELKKSESNAGRSSRAPPPHPVIADINDLLIPIVVKDLENICATTVELVKLCRLPPIPDLPDFFYQSRTTFEAQYPRVTPNAIENPPASKNKTSVGADANDTTNRSNTNNNGNNAPSKYDPAVPSSLIVIKKKKGLTRNQRRQRLKEYKKMELQMALALRTSQNNEVGIESDAGCQKTEKEKMNGTDSIDITVNPTHDGSEGSHVEGNSGFQKTEVATNADNNDEEGLDHSEVETKDGHIIEDDCTTTGGTLPNNDTKEDEKIEARDDACKVVDDPKTPNKTVESLPLVKRGSRKTRKRNQRNYRKRKALEESKALTSNSSNSKIVENNIEGLADSQKTEDNEMIDVIVITTTSTCNVEELSIQDDSDFMKKVYETVLAEDQNITTNSDFNDNREANNQADFDPGPVKVEDVKIIKIEEDLIIAADTLNSTGNSECQNFENGPDVDGKEDQDMIEKDITTVAHFNDSEEGQTIPDNQVVPKTEIEDMEVDDINNSITVPTISPNTNAGQSVVTEEAKVKEDSIVSATPSSSTTCEGQNTQNGSELKKKEDQDTKEEAIVTPTTTRNNGNNEGHKTEDESSCLTAEVKDAVAAIPGPSSNSEMLKIEDDSGIDMKQVEEMTGEDITVTTTTLNNSNKSISAKPGKVGKGRLSSRPHLLKKIQAYACSKADYKRRHRLYISIRNEKIFKFFTTNTLVMTHGEISVQSTPTKFCRQCQKKYQCDCE